MASPCQKPIRERELQGLKYFRLLLPFTERLHNDATERDRAGNRRLFFDQYACLLLLFFFNPIVRSIRGLQRASQLHKVQKLLGCERSSLGSLSEASRVFDPELLQQIIGELARQAKPLMSGKDTQALCDLEAVDGSLLPALPKMAWALWQDKLHRAARIHVHFDVLKGIPPRSPSPLPLALNATSCGIAWTQAASTSSTGVTAIMTSLKRSLLPVLRSWLACRTTR
jgi:hypothetical protein